MRFVVQVHAYHTPFTSHRHQELRTEPVDVRLRTFGAPFGVFASKAYAASKDSAVAERSLDWLRRNAYGAGLDSLHDALSLLGWLAPVPSMQARLRRWARCPATFRKRGRRLCHLTLPSVQQTVEETCPPPPSTPATNPSHKRMLPPTPPRCAGRCARQHSQVVPIDRSHSRQCALCSARM